MSPTDSLPWRTSSFSGAGENCVEVAPGVERVLVRHSKHRTDGEIAFSPTAWAEFVRAVLDDREPAAGSDADAVVTVTRAGGDRLVSSPSSPAGPTLRFDAGEWAAFVAGANAGEFDFTL